MSADTRTDDELRAVIQGAESAREEMSRRHAARAASVETRVRRALSRDPAAAFGPAELRYAAWSRCDCGAGMAYPVEIGPHGAWHCAAILRGTADAHVAHTPPMPFSFYELKSEGQPSAGGATTRPVEDKTDAGAVE